jgi:hypothetical protein
MVALLWDAGLVAAAVELEAMWNGLGRRHPLHTAVIGQPLAGRPIPGGTVARTRTFAACLGAPAAARHFVVAALSHQGGHLADDAALAVTEMAANVGEPLVGVAGVPAPRPPAAARADQPAPPQTSARRSRLPGLARTTRVKGRVRITPERK